MPITWKLGDTINCTHWKVALEERNLFCRYDRDVVLMATKPSAANRCAHLETSPKIWDFLIGLNSLVFNKSYTLGFLFVF